MTNAPVPALRFERHLPHTIDRVWRAVTDPAELDCWFVAAVPWGPTLGETFEAHGQTGRIEAVDPPVLLAWTFGEERYSFELEATEAGCRLVFTHVFDPRLGPAEQHERGWRIYLRRLDVHLGGGFVSEADAHELAAGRAVLEEGPVLCFERRLPHPVERVWRALADPEEQRLWFPSGEPLAVTRSEPPHRLEGTWHGDALRMELLPDEAGCLLVFTHAFVDRDTAARTAAGWDRCLSRLDALLDGEPLDEAAALEAWPGVHETYAEAFAVDPELGRRAYAEHPLT